MKAAEIAELLVTRCRDGKYVEAITELYAPAVRQFENGVLEMEYDVTPHATKQRQQWREAAVYRVSGGKITDVRFYYKPPEAA